MICIIMEDLMSRIQRRLNSNYPPWSWATKHSCWNINRYPTYHGITTFELVHTKNPREAWYLSDIQSMFIWGHKLLTQWKDIQNIIWLSSWARPIVKIFGLYQMAKELYLQEMWEECIDLGRYFLLITWDIPQYHKIFRPILEDAECLQKGQLEST